MPGYIPMGMYPQLYIVHICTMYTHSFIDVKYPCMYLPFVIYHNCYRVLYLVSSPGMYRWDMTFSACHMTRSNMSWMIHGNLIMIEILMYWFIISYIVTWDINLHYVVLFPDSGELVLCKSCYVPKKSIDEKFKKKLLYDKSYCHNNRYNIYLFS